MRFFLISQLWSVLADVRSVMIRRPLQCLSLTATIRLRSSSLTTKKLQSSVGALLVGRRVYFFNLLLAVILMG